MEYILGSQLAHHPSPGTAPCTQAVLSQRTTLFPRLLSLFFLRTCWSTPDVTAIPPCLCDTKKIMVCDSRRISSSSLLLPMLHACVQALPRGTLVSCWVFSSQCPVGTPCFLAIAYKQFRWPCLTLFCWFCVPLRTHYPESFACNGVCHVLTGLLVTLFFPHHNAHSFLFHLD